jgi:hypothetical protein
MRPIRSLLIYFATVFLGGALLAPWLYWAAQWAAGQGPIFARLAASPFHRFVDRALLGAALLGLWPLLRHCAMLRWDSLGLRIQRGAGRQGLLGFSLGWVSLACVALTACVVGARSFTPSHSAAEWLSRIVSAALTAVIVAVLEELLFRGALFGILRKIVPWPWALVISSAIFALVHFIQKTDAAPPIRWFSGLALLPQMFHQGGPFVPAFFTLFVVGAILALAYQRTGSLFFSIGLHAGWIFWLKSYRFLTHESGGRQAFWGTDNLIDGWLALGVLAVVFVFVARRLQSAGVSRN